MYEALPKVQGRSIPGAAWITEDAQCMVKFVTDYSFTAKNGPHRLRALRRHSDQALGLPGLPSLNAVHARPNTF